MEDETLALSHLDQLGDVVQGLREVDEGVLARAEHAEEAIEPDVDGRRLHAAGIEWIDPDAAGRDGGTDVTVGQDHDREVWAGHDRRERTRCDSARARYVRGAPRRAAASSRSPTSP